MPWLLQQIDLCLCPGERHVQNRQADDQSLRFFMGISDAAHSSLDSVAIAMPVI